MQHGLTLRALADHVHYSHVYLWEIEKGIKKPSRDVIEACDRFLCAGGDLVAMLGDDGDVNRREVLALIPSFALDSLRQRLDDASSDDLDQVEDRVSQYARACITEPPSVMLQRMTVELASLRDNGDRQCQLRARLSVLIADELNVVADPTASSWYITAIRCADATSHQGLKADVRVLASLHPLYGGQPQRALDLLREAQALSDQRETGALAPTLEGFAWSLLGDSRGAHEVFKIAEVTLEHDSHDHQSVLGFSERRFAFYQSRMSLRTQSLARAWSATDAALALYPSQVLGDRAIIELDRAAFLARVEPANACRYAHIVLSTLPTEHRGGIFRHLGQSVLNAIPTRCRPRRELADLLRTFV